MFSRSVILITGGTGTFGNALLRRMLSTDVDEIRIFSRDETKQHAMRCRYNDPRLSFYLGDVRRPESLFEAMDGVDYVFHAAALKHVPACECHPMEALLTNAVGAENVLQAAIDANVKRVVVISTDKAAYPINTMGISKAMMERLAFQHACIAEKHGCTIVVVRCGNLLGSRGSVLGLFMEQIQADKPLTITNPAMTRFVMKIDDAVDLVLFAFQYGSPGDLFVHKAPTMTIGILASALKLIFHVDTPVEIIGIRPGDKMHETLLTSEELVRAIDLGAYFRVPCVKDQRTVYSACCLEKATIEKDYNSQDIPPLDLERMVALVGSLEEVQAEVVLHQEATDRWERYALPWVEDLLLEGQEERDSAG